MDLIDASAVSKRFGGVIALSGAEFHAPAGEVHALIGENGAGKSTFIQILAGAVRPDDGTILFGGRPYAATNPSAAQSAGISAVFQELSLIPDLTIEENVWFHHEPMTSLGTVNARALRHRTFRLFNHFGFPALKPDREVRRLSLAERQLVEIAKALARNPKVLILDEATSSLAQQESEWLLGLARRIAAEGKLVIYISHRLAEIRHIADRITVFRNGSTVATHDADAVTDSQLVTEMLGRRLDRLFPDRRPTATRRVALSVRGLSIEGKLKDISFDLLEGEVLGIGGLQGHGQRELFQALFGVSNAKGSVELWGRPWAMDGPAQALKASNGLALVPEDRRGQGLLQSKSVGENLTLCVIPRFSRFGLLDHAKEKNLIHQMVEFLQIKARSPDQLAGTLSGGNQQKVVFGKILLTQARVLLLFDPTRGVDVGTKGEIFQLMRDLGAQHYALLFYSSDLSELTHVADRVAVMRNGRIADVLEGDTVTEEGILKAAMLEGGQPTTDTETTSNAKHVAARQPLFDKVRLALYDNAPFVVAVATLVALLMIYGSMRADVFSLNELNIDAAATLTLLLAGTGQTVVLLRGGIDLSIGGMVSLGTVLAATRFGDDIAAVVLWSSLILLIGAGAGIINGLIISYLRLQPFLVTLATWSIISGTALLILPTDGGKLPQNWMAFGSATFLGLSSSVWLLIGLYGFWLWFKRTHLGLMIRATGSHEKSAFLSGVSLIMINTATYAVSGLFAALAALYLTTQTGAGSPTIGKDYILTSVAAAVIGGTSLFGGRGGVSSTIVGAFILTIIGNLVFVLSVSSYWQPIVSAVILLGAVLASSLAERSARRSLT
jgi:ribose transport system ATP-binding protein